ncbi:hypothetical protein ACK1CN_00755 [Vibrio coralliilyticus]|uniref:hypothetical protein n=1 Tax=Vibrio coralliilyticus TaxID=190893 RepID=UPI0039172D20
MLDRQEILFESVRFRRLIQRCDPTTTALVTDEFPVMNCKLTSMILVYHFLKLHPEIEIRGIGGVRPDNRIISHYWIELEGYAIDITGDQYNLIDDHELDEVIISFRPYLPIHIVSIKDSFLYDLFEMDYIDTFSDGLPGIKESFIEKLESTYEQLMAEEEAVN